MESQWALQEGYLQRTLLFWTSRSARHWSYQKRTQKIFPQLSAPEWSKYWKGVMIHGLFDIQVSKPLVGQRKEEKMFLCITICQCSIEVLKGGGVMIRESRIKRIFWTCLKRWNWSKEKTVDKCHTLKWTSNIDIGCNPNGNTHLVIIVLKSLDCIFR